MKTRSPLYRLALEANEGEANVGDDVLPVPTLDERVRCSRTVSSLILSAYAIVRARLPMAYMRKISRSDQSVGDTTGELSVPL